METFLISKITEIDAQRVETLADEVTVIPMEKARDLAAFIQKRIEQIVAAHLARQADTANS